jgi:hypothetical protein
MPKMGQQPQAKGFDPIKRQFHCKASFTKHRSKKQKRPEGRTVTETLGVC